MNQRPKLSIMLTCHNRRDTTLACLDRVAHQDVEADLTIVVVDASSSDGTAQAVKAAHPDAVVEVVGSDVFWNGGMHRAWQIATGLDVDGHVWLNDDTLLDEGALQHLVDTWQSLDDSTAIIVGTTRDPSDDTPTYGGVRRPDRRRPLAYELVSSQDVPVRAETMNGNVVLVPSPVVDRIGILEPIYTHGMGDFDYGHRAVAAGIDVWVAPGTHGTCARNDDVPAPTGLRDEVRRLRRPTGLPPRDFARFARRWAGPAWPLYWASPYLRRLWQSLRP